jgi:uncharacterized repeat protein (TIGR01451 family)
LYLANQSDAGTGSISGWSISFDTYLPIADLGVALNAIPAVGILSNNATISLTVTNRGPAAANAIVLTNTFPGLSFLSLTSNIGSIGVIQDGFTWSIPALLAGAGTQCSWTVLPSSAGTFTNTANVTAREPDPQPGNNSAFLLFSVIVHPDPVTLAEFGINASMHPVFKFDSSLGLNYTIEYTDSLGAPDWKSLAHFAGTGGSIMFEDSTALSAARFYRVRTN